MSQTRVTPEFIYEKRVRYHEIDAQAVVYNAHYLTYFDIALTEFARDKGWLSAPYQGFDFHVVKAEVNYRKPMRLDEVVKIGASVKRVGRSSVTFSIVIFTGDDDIRADGEVVWVWTDQETGRSAPLPEHILALFQAKALPHQA